MNGSGAKSTAVDVPLGARIAEVREARGLGLREAARLCHIDPTKLADAESGKDSRASTVAAIARGLSVSADYLLGLSDLSEAKTPVHTPSAPATPPAPDRLQELEDLVETQDEDLDRTIELLVTLAAASGLPRVEQAARDLLQRRSPG